MNYDQRDMNHIIVSLTRVSSTLLSPACEYLDFSAIRLAKKTLSLAEEIYRQYQFENSTTPVAVYKRVKEPSHSTTTPDEQ